MPRSLPVNATLLAPALPARVSVPRLTTRLHVRPRGARRGGTQRFFSRRPGSSASIRIVTVAASESVNRSRAPIAGRLRVRGLTRLPARKRRGEMVTFEKAGRVVSGVAGGPCGGPAGGGAGSGPNGQSPRSARATTRAWSVPGGIATRSSAKVSNATQLPSPEMLGTELDTPACAPASAVATAHELGRGRGGIAQEHVRRAVDVARDEVARGRLERDPGAGRVDRRPLGDAVARDAVRARRAADERRRRRRHVAHEHVADRRR